MDNLGLLFKTVVHGKVKTLNFSAAAYICVGKVERADHEHCMGWNGMLQVDFARRDRFQDSQLNSGKISHIATYLSAS